MKLLTRAAAAAVLALALAGCATTASTPTASSAPPSQTAAPLPRGLDPQASANPFPSTYRPLPSRPTAVVGATVLTGTGDQLENGVVLMRDGKIEAVGANLAVPAGYETVDGHGRWVTPGIIDAHSHLGVY